MDILNKDIKFRYSLLDRMRQEVGYCIRLIDSLNEDHSQFDANHILVSYLSEGPDNHFSVMSDLFKSFSEEEQPEFYTFNAMQKDKARLEHLTKTSLG